MKKIIIFIFLISCSSTNNDNMSNFDNIDFYKNLSFIEFENLLNKYVNDSNYPNIDK